jgi:hypothetical protein
MKSRIKAALPALVFALVFVAAAPSVLAQRPRAVENDPAAATPTPTPAPAPATVKAKYEGGMIGYPKADGFISFDDVNRRLVFQDKNRREVFSLSYDAMLAAWPDTKSRTSTAGQVIARTAPYGLGLPALLFKDKSRYLVLRFSDPDVPTTDGMTSFKLESKEMLASVIHTLAQKAEMTQRGDAYIRAKTSATTAKP